MQFHTNSNSLLVHKNNQMNVNDVSTNVLGIGDLFEKPLVANKHDLERLENEISRTGISDSRGSNSDSRRITDEDAAIDKVLADLNRDDEFAIPMSRGNNYSRDTRSKSKPSPRGVSVRNDRRDTKKEDKSRRRRRDVASDSESNASESTNASKSSRSSGASKSSGSSKSSRSSKSSKSSATSKSSASSDNSSRSSQSSNNRRGSDSQRGGRNKSRERKPTKVDRDSKWNKTHYREAPSARPSMSKDEYKRENAIVDDIIGVDYAATNIDPMLMQIKQKNWRIQTLANIRTLRESLEDDIDESMMKLIPEVDYESEDKVIENVHDMLQYIDRRQSNYAITSSVVDMSCEAIGEFFDGTRSVFGIKPHLKGLNETAMARLKKMEFQATELTENIMAENGIIGWKRLLMESIVALYTHHKSNVLRESTGTAQRNVTKQTKDSLHVLDDL